MATIVFIIWCMCIIISLCTLFLWPKNIFKRLKEYRFLNYSRDLTKEDIEFVDHHVQLIESHQSIISNQKRPFILGQWSFVLLFLVFMAMLVMLFIWSAKFNNWLTDLTINRPYTSSALLNPFPSILTLCLAIFLGSIIWLPVLQIMALRRDKEKLTYNLLMPNYETKIGTEAFSIKLEEIRARIANNLAVLIREDMLDSSKNFFLDEILGSLIEQQSRAVKRLGAASLAVMILVYIMDTFNFVKITSDEIVYSPAFSFKVISKKFEDVTSANYICVNEDNSRRLKLSVKLDNGYEFRVRKYQIEEMGAVIETNNIVLRNIDDADEWCKNLK